VRLTGKADFYGPSYGAGSAPLQQQQRPPQQQPLYDRSVYMPSAARQDAALVSQPYDAVFAQ
jgi:hypothetical protein